MVKDMSKQLIVIEGALDGIGKTTQVKLLENHLKKDNIGFIFKSPCFHDF